MAEFRDSERGTAIRPTVKLSGRKARRRTKTWLRKTIHRFEHSPFPLFGLAPTWSGDRWFAGGSWGGVGRRETTESLSLGHGPWMTDRAVLRVQSEAPGLAQPRNELQYIAHFRWREGAADVDEAIDRYRTGRRVGNGIEVERPVEASAEIRIDGTAMPFRVLRRGRSWVAGATRPDVWIMIDGDWFDIDEVELVTVRDLRPYIDGTRSRLLPPTRR
jgi:hypothetical protein